MTRSTLSLIALFASISLAPIASAQNPASFGDVYGPNQSTVQARVDNTYALRGQFYANSSSSNPGAAGSISLANSFYSSGNGSYLMLPVTFTPTQTGGNISASATTTYTCNGSCTQSSITITVNASGTSYTGTETAGLKYQVLSILYTPPGNASSSGFSNSVSQGQSVSTSDDFAAGESIQFRGSAPGATASVTFSTTVDQGSATNSSTQTQATGGSQLNAVSQPIDHNQDQVFLLVDPSVTVVQNGPSSGYVTIGGSLDAQGNFGPNGVPNDIINVNIAGLKNPSLIPIAKLQDQVLGSGQVLPGLRYVCANPLPSNQCTQQNACGCTASDFAPIVAQDELANNTNQSTNLDSIDANRFVYINNLQLQGPDQAGADPVRNMFSLTDSSTTTKSTTDGASYGVAFSKGFGVSGFGFDLKSISTTSFTFKQSQTVGTTNGSAHTGTVTLGTNDAGCFEYVNVYEDTIYHTFAYSLAQPAPSSCQ